MHFNPRAPHGARPSARPTDRAANGYFNPRAPHGARPAARVEIYPCADFNPRAPHGARQRRRALERRFTTFQSTRPAWGATKQFTHCLKILVFQSTRPAWGATLFPRLRSGLLPFQSTRPAWGATAGNSNSNINIFHFNPRAPHGARQQRCTKMHPAFAAKATNIRRGGRKMRPFSTDWWGKTRRFSPPCRCEPPGDLLGAWPSPKGSLAPRAGRSACSRNARSSFRTAAPDNKTADCPARGP